MGSGAFLLEVIRAIAAQTADDQGPGAVGPALHASLTRLIGFELQLGPFAVAQLRLLAELAQHGQSDVDPGMLRTYITNTLEDPYVEETQLGTWYKPITDARRAANRVKSDKKVLVVLGNPPYKDRSRGAGGWIEGGAQGHEVPLERFFPDPSWGVSAHTRHLYNAYIYFWRWATWKVFDSETAAGHGVICFITVAGFLNGPGFEGMRRYLRESCEDIWIIDCSPEGFTPPVNTRIFEAMKHEVCITIAVRTAATHTETPARVRYRELDPAPRADKFTQLHNLHLNDAGWQDCAGGWRAPFLPAAEDDWASYLSLDDVFLYGGTGVMAGRSWIMDPDVDSLVARWDALISEPDRERKRALLAEHRRDRTIDKELRDALPGFPRPASTIAEERDQCPPPVRVSFRSFDRRWIIPDKRVINQPNPTLWAGRSGQQMWITAPARESPSAGPALTGCAAIPDVHHYNGRGGRVYPLWQDSDGRRSNINTALLQYVSSTYGYEVSASDAVAYIAGICAHPRYTEKFADNFTTPGLRVPWTKNAELFAAVRDLGAKVLWLHTFGEAYVDPSSNRPKGAPRLPAGQRPQIPVDGTISDDPTEMPETLTYDAETSTLRVGHGFITNVSPAMWHYEVSGVHVVREWFNDRKRDRTPTVIGDRIVSPLWQIHSDHWRATYTAELLDLLNVLGCLSEMEEELAGALEDVAAGEVITLAELTAAQVLPINAAARTIRVAEPAGRGEGLFDLNDPPV